MKPLYFHISYMSQNEKGSDFSFSDNIITIHKPSTLEELREFLRERQKERTGKRPNIVILSISPLSKKVYNMLNHNED